MRNRQRVPLAASISRALHVSRPLAAIAVLGASCYVNEATAQLPRYSQRSLASLSPVKVAYISAPALADIDADADTDVILGSGDGTLRYFRRDRWGFAERVSSDNPFDGETFGSLASPAAGDIDGDSDLDVVVGNGEGVFEFLENQGSLTTPVFNRQTGSSNPLDGFDVGTRATPFLADLDNDGDLDLVSGSAAGAIRYYENISTVGNVAFEERVDAANPFDGIESGDGDSAPALVDLDADGDLDLVVGGLFGMFQGYENTGTPESATFAADAEGPLSEINLGLFSKVAFADIDRDGDIDAITGEEYGEVVWYRNIQTAETPVFVPVRSNQSPFFGIDVGYDSAFALADIDGDGDLDGAYGNRFGDVNILENQGTRFDPRFSIPDTGNVVRGGTRYFTAPAFADLDGDGDPELVVGDDSGRVRYFGRTGGFQFTELTGSANPFSSFLFTQNTTFAFVDIDADGDLDAASGSFEGTLIFLENTSAPMGPPTFEIRLDAANPFDGFEVGANSAPAFADVDEDGDFDLVIGGETLTVLFYAENIGTAAAPSFIERSGLDSPLGLNPVGRSAAPFAADINGNGDTDFIVGRGQPGAIFLIDDVIFIDGFEEDP